ncbi:MAG: hypothetical protein JWM38_103, partial [Sphingomonas bacterium]|nr:hypothetical protein [Sphingomonas bacterium]
MSPIPGWNSATVELEPWSATVAPYAVRGITEEARLLIDALPLGLALLDYSGNLMAWNDAFRLSIDCECVVGQPLPALMTTAEDRPAMTAAIATGLRSGRLPTTIRLRVAARP